MRFAALPRTIHFFSFLFAPLGQRLRSRGAACGRYSRGGAGAAVQIFKRTAFGAENLANGNPEEGGRVFLRFAALPRTIHFFSFLFAPLGQRLRSRGAACGRYSRGGAGAAVQIFKRTTFGAENLANGNPEEGGRVFLRFAALPRTIHLFPLLFAALGPEAAKPRRCLRQIQPRRSRGSRPNFQANRVRRRKFGKRQPGGERAGFLALCRPTANHSSLSLAIRCARPRGCEAEALPAADTAEAEQGQPSKFSSEPRSAQKIWQTATRRREGGFSCALPPYREPFISFPFYSLR